MRLSLRVCFRFLVRFVMFLATSLFHVFVSSQIVVYIQDPFHMHSEVLQESRHRIVLLHFLLFGVFHVWSYNWRTRALNNRGMRLMFQGVSSLMEDKLHGTGPLYGLHLFLKLTLSRSL